MMAQQQHSLNTGRNLPVATAVGLLLLGSIIASLAYSPVVFAVLAAGMGAMGAKELLAFWPATSERLMPRLMMASSAGVVLFGFYDGVSNSALVSAGVILILSALRLREGIDHFFQDVSLLTFTIFYTGLLLAFALLGVFPWLARWAAAAIRRTAGASDGR